jgi:hypothetical protein
MKKKFTILKKVEQAEVYFVEAESAHEALELFKANPDKTDLQWASEGWSYGDKKLVVFAEGVSE